MLGRIFLASLALLMAIPAGALALMGGVLLDPALRETFGRLGLTGLLAGLADLAAGLPPVLTALIGELFGLRSALWYGGFCAGLTAALPWLARGAAVPTGSAAAAEARLSALFLATGAVSGLTYWLIAGRTPGRPPAR